jgi:hypothetical protein
VEKFEASFVELHKSVETQLAGEGATAA